MGDAQDSPSSQTNVAYQVTDIIKSLGHLERKKQSETTKPPPVQVDHSRENAEERAHTDIADEEPDYHVLEEDGELEEDAASDAASNDDPTCAEASDAQPDYDVLEGPDSSPGYSTLVRRTCGDYATPHAWSEPVASRNGKAGGQMYASLQQAGGATQEYQIVESKRAR